MKTFLLIAITSLFASLSSGCLLDGLGDGLGAGVGVGPAPGVGGSAAYPPARIPQ